jgi:hypothetical protein
VEGFLAQGTVAKPGGQFMAITKRYPAVLARCPSALQWLEILHNFGRAPATLDAYALGLAHYLHACEQTGVEAQAATFNR